MRNLKNYVLTPELLAYKFEYEGEMLSLQEIIDKEKGFTNLVTKALGIILEGYPEVRFELQRSSRAKAAMGNQRGKGGKKGRTWKRKDKSLQNPNN